MVGMISIYSVYAAIHNTWIISPPNYILFIVSLLAFILGIAGFRDKSSRFAKLRSWFSTLLSILLIFIFFVAMLFSAMFSGSKELLTSVQSPDQKYKIDFYSMDAGAMGTFGVLGELRGPLWFKKKIFMEKRVNQVQVEWVNNHTALINNRKLNLSTGEPLFLD
jgi:hypothetical protein